MNQTTPFLSGKMRDLLEELHAHSTAEDKLLFLIEREPFVPPLSPSQCTDGNRIQGCRSGLWISAENADQLITFRSFSDSHVLNGISRFICDICSGLESSALKYLDLEFEKELKLNTLLTDTRKIAVSKIFDKIRAFAST